MRAVQESLSHYEENKDEAEGLNQSMVAEDEATYNKVHVIAELEEEMRDAAAKLEFERAAHLRDQLKQLQKTK